METCPHCKDRPCINIVINIQGKLISADEEFIDDLVSDIRRKLEKPIKF